MPDYAARLAAVQAAMRTQKVDLLYLSRSANLSYVIGLMREEPNFGNTIYPGEWLTGAWIAAAGAPILTLPRMLADFHLGDAGHAGAYDVRVLPDAGDARRLLRAVLDALRIAPGASVAVEDRCWGETVLHLRALLSGANFTLASTLLGPLRRIKDAEEIEILREAGRITEAAYADTLRRLRHGMTNLDLLTEVNYQLRRHGATGPSFATSFYNMGPGFPFDFSNRDAVLQIPLQPPVAISFDFGAAYRDYCYDFGRSLFFGEPDAEYRRAHALVMEAQAAGIAALRTGVSAESADAAARGVIEAGGFGSAFRHRLGHGIGMDVHEAPFLTQGDATLLEEGMCFTVEPSIFIPHRFGARVEDVVVVRPAGGEPLTTGNQSLLVID